jgi:hypothetical protein
MAAADKIRVGAERKAEKKASKNTNGEDEEKSGSNKGDKGPKKPRAKTCKRRRPPRRLFKALMASCELGFCFLRMNVQLLQGIDNLRVCL